ncbi:hypothetical protein O6H91_14G010700 [Diphasiastrum complanatum]|uniref:Uncharacterized protein n=1 Tax=Diphasiastrum complanatum TaxID=34168 RepID=A0ACC2BLH8_DIPCM|nr:hypothetical protein O6H91_14G010700 [Diphasiastrum complanatum]
MENSQPVMKVANAVVALVRGRAESVLTERNKDEGRRLLPPNPVKVPPKRMFGYPEKYKSPTDSLVSPISRGLLARNRRPSRLLAPPVPPKALESTFQNIDSQNVTSE